MHRTVAALAGLVLMTTPAFATCKDEVAAAFAKQRAAGSFRMVTSMVSEQGPIEMMVDYVLPDRMHQRVTVKKSNTTVETILVAAQAWTNEGKGWVVVPSEFVDEMAKQMREAVADPPQSALDQACLGTVSVEGRELLAYRPEDGQAETAKTGGGTPKPPARMLYVDPATGLPVRNTVALADKPDAPFFNAEYSYPTGITVAPPEVKTEPAESRGSGSP